MVTDRQFRRLRKLLQTESTLAQAADKAGVDEKTARKYRDSIRLSKRRPELTGERFGSRRWRLGERLHELLARPWEQRHARRLVKRLRRHEGELFTFLDHPGVPFDNNHSERMIRPAVIVRKNSYANGSEAGAETQAVLMSVFCTLK